MSEGDDVERSIRRRDARGGVLDPLARRVRSTPDRTALVDAVDGRALRYDELDSTVETVARHLAGLGLVHGDHLGLLADTSIGTIHLLHAAWRLGLRVVPLNVRLTDGEVIARVNRVDLDAVAVTAETANTASSVTDCPVVLVDRDTHGESNAFGDQDEFGVDEGTVDGLDAEVDCRPIWEVSPADSDDVAATYWDLDDVALTLFTSGTTGEPKAVELTMGNLLASATASAFRLGVLPSDRWLHCLPIYHVGGLAPVVRTATYGTTLVVMESFDPEAVVRATRERDVTGLSLVPTQLGRIFDVDPDAAWAESIRTILLGGAPARPSLIDRCRRTGVPVYPTYGLTETASQVATATPEEAFTREGTVGQRLLDVRVTVVDDDLDPVPVGDRGEIVVSGPNVTPGYYDDPVTTEEVFCAFGLRTGDLGHIDGDGRLWVTGRLGDRIVTGGENVHPTEVAGVIRRHDGVADVAVVGIPDPDWGERIGAVVVPDPERPVDVDELVAYCRDHLAGFKVPKTLATADRLPRTDSGTVDRDAVRRFLTD